ncbi:hypothetical protein ABPG74_003172 [Tetrahymena malaccensis]
MSNQQGPEDNNLEDDMAYLPADHALLAKLQIHLTKQLTDEHERVDQKLIEIDANLKKLEKTKEDIGVRLYSVQQQLAENQMNFEQAHENYNWVQKLRIEAEQKLKTESEVYDAKKKELEELRKKYLKAQDELSKLTRTLYQINEFNQQMKGQIINTKTNTYRAEENVVNLEAQKKKQDLLIDTMNEEIKRQTEQKTILTAQLISQKEETEQAKQILKEAHLEMQKIIASKKNLLERWQKSLMTMQRMDNALQAIKEALKGQQELNLQIGTELNGVNAEIRKETEIQENLEGKNKKFDYEKDYLQKKYNELQEEKSKLEAQINLLTQSLRQTETEAGRAEIDKRSIEDQMNLIETNIMKLHTETKKLWEDLVHQKSEHTTIEKTATNLNKQANQISIEIEDKSVELENLLNEIARVKIDQLNTLSQIEVLENKRREVIKEREEKEITVATYEVQIRQGHDLNEKKQHEVGRLNREHDKLSSVQSDMSRGPLEAKRNNLIRKTQELGKENDLMQREWIKKQTLLVTQNNRLNRIEEDVSQLKTKQTILEQKKLRLNNNYRIYEKDIREIQNALKNLRNEMNKLNDAIYRNKEKQQKLDNENFNIKSEFVEKLKELEKESVKLEVEIDRLKEEKADLLAEIVESERQILLWERKIQLEKEMQDALDPTVGQTEIQELKREIHRMELRLDDLRKKQEAIIAEMERAVYKRETIQLKYMNKDKTFSNSNTMSQKSSSISAASDNSALITKKIAQLKTTLNQTTRNAEQMEKAIKSKKVELDDLNSQIEGSNDNLQKLESDCYNKNIQLTKCKLERSTNILNISCMQNRAKKLEDLAAGKARLSVPEATLMTKYEELRDKNLEIKEALQKLCEDAPQYVEVLQYLIDLNVGDDDDQEQ